MSDATVLSIAGNITNITSAQAREINTKIAGSQTLSTLLQFYTQASEQTGSVIIFDYRYACLPYMMGNDKCPVLLYQFIEVLEEFTDFDRIRAEFPTLSYGQISGAIDFLRKLSQFNMKNEDIDSLEERFIEGNAEFQAKILESLKNQEQTSVLTTE